MTFAGALSSRVPEGFETLGGGSYVARTTYIAKI